MKACSACKITKPATEYFPHKTMKDGRASQCKECSKKCTRRTQNKIKTLIRRLKLKLGCEVCGYKKCATSLHFDHVDPATKSPRLKQGHGLYRIGYNNLKAELRKCRVLCANCHGEHTELQRKTKLI